MSFSPYASLDYGNAMRGFRANAGGDVGGGLVPMLFSNQYAV